MFVPSKYLVKMYGYWTCEERTQCWHPMIVGDEVRYSWIEGDTPGWKRFMKRMKRRAQRRVDGVLVGRY